MHQCNIGRVVQRSTRWQQVGLCQQLFCMLMTGFSQVNLMRLFINRKVTWRDHTLTGTRISLTNLQNQFRNDFINGQINSGVVISLTADD